MTILIDTSVWIDNFRKAEPGVVELVRTNAAVIHPGVIGELALGSIRQRERFLAFLTTLPRLEVVTEHALLQFIDERNLAGRGIGLIDAQLLAACCAQSVSLWTSDKRLQAQAERLGLAYAA